MKLGQEFTFQCDICGEIAKVDRDRPPDSWFAAWLSVKRRYNGYANDFEHLVCGKHDWENTQDRPRKIRILTQFLFSKLKK